MLTLFLFLIGWERNDKNNTNIPPDISIISLSVTPATTSLPVGLHKQLKAEEIRSDSSVLDVTIDDAISWSSSDPAVATISSSGDDKGQVTGVAPGTVTITASGQANGQHFSASAEVEVNDEALLGFFTTPDTITRQWGDAVAYCKGLAPAARLPTRAELQNLFLQSTSATAIGQSNTEMCDVYGWPLRGLCGGWSDTYWTSTTSGPDYHRAISMVNGGEVYTENLVRLHVTCIR